MNYSYLADGTKVSALDGDGDGLLYLGSLIYRKTGSRWDVATGLTDHTNRFRYNSKEEQFRFGTPYIDYGARQYDSLLGRWFAQDPLTEEYFSTSPHVFCIGNSLKYVDTNGLSITDTLQLAPAVIIAPQPYRSQDIIWDFIPMYSYAVDADIAFQNRRYGEWIKNVILGTADGLLFLAGSPLLKAGGKFIKPKALKHIRKAHWFNSGMKNKGKFLKGITEKQLQQMIDITMKNGKKSINMTPNGGFVYI